MQRMQNKSCLDNLKLLWWLRNIAICGQAVAIYTVINMLHIPLKEKPLWAILGLMAVWNFVTFLKIKKAPQISEGEFLFHLLVDISALFFMLHFTGGASNPFAILFILQVIIAAITVSAIYTWFTAALTIILYTVLTVWKVEVPYFMHHHINDFFSLHVQGMWISFMLLATVGAWFVVRINSQIKKQDSRLAEAEKMAAIGALAANAAHELGTPLATLSILAENYVKEGKYDLFASELARCKKILSGITAAGGVSRAEGGSRITLQEFANQIITMWQQRKPDAKLAVSYEGSAPDVKIIADITLFQAIFNLLDNAYDASPDYVGIKFTYLPDRLKITIEDKGLGIAQEMKNNIGKPGYTTKKNGMGMGFFLAKNIITLTGGQLTFETDNAGTKMNINLPLKGVTV